jgi:hypothetical protein
MPGTVQYWWDFGYSAAGDLDSAISSEENPPPVNYNISSFVAYEYDQKVNPLKLGEEAVLFFQFPFFGSHNAVRMESVLLNSPQPPFLSTTIHSYNNDGFPATSVTNKSSGGVTNTTWYYQ